MAERTIARIKPWRIHPHRLRRPLHTFEQTITAILSLYVFKTSLWITFGGLPGEKSSLKWNVLSVSIGAPPTKPGTIHN